ncbi:DNA-binding transcriptional LysR family regulator [Paraburkholderia sp. RAU2J]|uniref:LysR substrate-binding domain-containing protein n=1 Tax=Paraburkholderia sp. RAU2J TaxID=1938810 RepID=UPI000EB39F2D|nr:LysR substrate-binding domain-containing protein [Paraburkholderia sp. RAU2J]RKT13482.1 DNA-binding transcriptional LysR family regulator [Paraburkholderia sp. RAU2J]
MRKFRIPNIGTLQAYEATARHESVTHAAKELSLTESAVSRQISTLESNLGVQLFVRVKQRLVLTRAGRLYSGQVRSALESLARATRAIVAHGGQGDDDLEVVVLPTFAMQWLIPRLKNFNDRYPGIRVNMSVRITSFNLTESHFEAAIHHGDQHTWPGTSTDFLFDEEPVPVCSPSLITKPIQSADELLAYPLLQLTSNPDSWTEWFADLGVEDDRTAQGARFEMQGMLIAGAVEGLGIALVPKVFVEGRLHELGLTVPFSAKPKLGSAYHLVYPTEFSHNTSLRAFRNWLLEEARIHRTTPHD